MNKYRLITLVTLLITITFMVSSCSDDDDNNSTSPQEPTDIQITALIPLTGDLGGYGTQLSLILDFALEDANVELESIGADIRLDLQIVDTETNPETARTQFETEVLNGCKYFLGPLTSGEIKEVTKSVSMSQAVIFSPASTSQEYALPNDHIYRLIPPDSIMILALAEVINYEGNTTLVPIAREDAWGSGVIEIIGNAFATLGGNIADTYQYHSFRRSQFREMLIQVAELLNSSDQAAEDIAIQLSSFEEGCDIFAIAKEIETDYPILGQIQWYGGDGMVQNEYLLSQADTCGLAAQTQFLCPSFGFDKGSDYDALISRYQETMQGEPWIYSVITYDALRMLAVTLGTMIDPEDISTFEEKLILTTEDYQGISGQISFDDNGDRAGGIFDFYRVVEDGNSYTWEKVYRNDNGTITQ